VGSQSQTTGSPCGPGYPAPSPPGVRTRPPAQPRPPPDWISQHL